MGWEKQWCGYELVMTLVIVIAKVGLAKLLLSWFCFYCVPARFFLLS